MSDLRNKYEKIFGKIVLIFQNIDHLALFVEIVRQLRPNVWENWRVYLSGAVMMESRSSLHAFSFRIVSFASVNFLGLMRKLNERETDEYTRTSIGC